MKGLREWKRRKFPPTRLGMNYVVRKQVTRTMAELVLVLLQIERVHKKLF